jgi:hypothetical protein
MLTCENGKIHHIEPGEARKGNTPRLKAGKSEADRQRRAGLTSV